MATTLVNYAPGDFAIKIPFEPPSTFTLLITSLSVRYPWILLQLNPLNGFLVGHG